MQIFHKLPLFFWLNDKGRKKTQNGGYQIIVPVLYGENNTVEFYEKYDTLNTTPQEGITVSKWDWRQLGGSVSISRKEERQNSGEHQLINLLETKIMQLEESMRWYINDVLHGRFGASGKTYCDDTSTTIDSVGGTSIGAAPLKHFTSLDHLVRMPWGYFDPASGTARTHYCGGITVSFTNGNSTGAGYADWNPTSGGLSISASTNPWWINYSNPGFLRLKRGGPLPGDVISQAEIEWAGECMGNSNQNLISAMRAMYNRLSDGGEHPDLGLCSQEVYDIYEGALMPLERFTDTKTGDAGFQNLKFKGMTLMFDHGITTALPAVAPTSTAPATPLYFLNSKYLAWVVDSQTDFITTPFIRPENQDAKTAQILLMANLVTYNRQKHGVIALANYATGYGTA